MTMPGKRPAANDLPLKPCCVWMGAGHPTVCDADAGVVVDDGRDAVGVVVEDVGVEDVGVWDAGTSSLEHMLPLHV